MVLTYRFDLYLLGTMKARPDFFGRKGRGGSGWQGLSA